MTRERLPNRRGGQRLTVEHRGIEYTVTVGFYDDGRLGELFVTAVKSGMEVQTVAHEAAVALSFALQYGAPLADLRAALPRQENGSAEGIMGVILDAIAPIVAEVHVAAKSEAGQ